MEVHVKCKEFLHLLGFWGDRLLIMYKDTHVGRYSWPFQLEAHLLTTANRNQASIIKIALAMQKQAKTLYGNVLTQLLDSNYLVTFEQACEQLKRTPRAMPALELMHDAPSNLFDVRFEHIGISGYHPHPAIKAPVAV